MKQSATQKQLGQSEFDEDIRKLEIKLNETVNKSGKPAKIKLGLSYADDTKSNKVLQIQVQEFDDSLIEEVNESLLESKFE